MPSVEQLAALAWDGTGGIPAAFVTHCSSADGQPESLFGEELECVARAVPVRRREFAAGRLLAREALSTLGAPTGPLVAARDRRPLWPAGYVGSISHAGGACVVSVGRNDAAASLGLDIDVDEALAPGVARLVCRPAELARVSALGALAGPRWAKVVFSVKEAVYKCLNPLTGLFLEFHDVEVELDLDTERFLARVLHPALAPTAYGQLAGRVVRGDGWILSAVSVPPTGTTVS